jgi:putative membrane protein
MMIAVFLLAGLAALFHVYVFYLESVAWTRDRTRATFRTTAQHAAITKPLAFNQGFYNLFLALGAAVGILLVNGDYDTAGWTLILFSCGSMLAAAVVLISTGLKYARAAVTQGLFPFIAVVTGIIASR